MEVAKERMKILKKYFPNLEERKRIITEFTDFSSKSGEFPDVDSIRDRYEMDPKSWWVTYGACAHLLQTLAFKCNLLRYHVQRGIGVLIPSCTQ